MHVNDGYVLLLNELLDLKDRIAAFESDCFGFLVERKDDPAVVVIVIGYNDGRSS